MTESQPTCEDVAGLIDFELARTELSETEVHSGCEAARRRSVASVIVRPCDVELVARWLAGSGVRLCALVDSPHGYGSTASKLYAARDLLRRGAQDVDTVMNTGKLISRQFQYLEMELLQMAESCHQSGGVLKVNLESEHLTEELKIVACRIARRAEADYIGTDRDEDIPLLKEHSRDKLKIKVIAPSANLEAILALRESGVARVQVQDENWGQSTQSPISPLSIPAEATQKIGD